MKQKAGNFSSIDTKFSRTQKTKTYFGPRFWTIEQTHDLNDERVFSQKIFKHIDDEPLITWFLCLAVGENPFQAKVMMEQGGIEVIGAKFPKIAKGLLPKILDALPEVLSAVPEALALVLFIFDYALAVSRIDAIKSLFACSDIVRSVKDQMASRLINRNRCNSDQIWHYELPFIDGAGLSSIDLMVMRAIAWWSDEFAVEILLSDPDISNIVRAEAKDFLCIKELERGAIHLSVRVKDDVSNDNSSFSTDEDCNSDFASSIFSSVSSEVASEDMSEEYEPRPTRRGKQGLFN